MKHDESLLLAAVTEQVRAAAFDAEWYLDFNPDVRDAGVDPFGHYLNHGWREGRDPCSWFSTRWYCKTVLEPLSMEADPLRHYWAIGRHGGFTPSEEAEEALRARARELFDESYYVGRYPDIDPTKIVPWDHYLTFGWREMRAPNATFDPLFYSHAQHASVPGKVPARDPLLHYVAIGRAAGLDTAAGELNVRHLNGLAYPAAESAAGPPCSPLDRVVRSAWFDPAHVATQDPSCSDTDRVGAAERFLESDCLDPSPLFSTSFYRAAYGDRLDAGEHPLVHYLRIGRMQGYYPTPTLAHRDYVLLSDLYPHAERATSVDDLDGADPNSAVSDYMFRSQYDGSGIDPDVDDAFVRNVYERLFPQGLGAPAAFVKRWSSSVWVYRNPLELLRVAKAVRNSRYFDSDHYAHTVGFDPAEIDPALHYAVHGIRGSIEPSAEFDAALYAYTYPDIVRAPVVPILHFEEHGEHEGRVRRVNVTEVPGGLEFDPTLPSVIVFSHEASYTGAPMVALNIARQLEGRANVVTWLGQDGPLGEEFAANAVAHLTGFAGLDVMTRKLAALSEEFHVDRAFVNSVVCHSVVPTLRVSGIAVVSVIHEFADYVHPAGATSRMAMLSGATVFPADIVREALTRDLAKIGGGRPPTTIIEHPQGVSPAPPGEGLTIDEVRTLLGVDADNDRQRVLFGAGWVQQRKGVDLFLQVAAELTQDKEHDWRFVWVGGNYRPDEDMELSVYLAHQVRASGLEGRMTFVDAQKDLTSFWEVADVFMMSSRLDPFPNVAIDALAAAVPVVCFRGATGVASLETKFPFAVRSVPFASAAAAAAAAKDMVASTGAAGAPFAREAIIESLSFRRYVDDLEALMDESVNRAREAQARLAGIESMDEADVYAAVDQLPSEYAITNIRRPELVRATLAEVLDHDRFGLAFTLTEGQVLRGLAGTTSHADLRPWRPGVGSHQGVQSLRELTVLICIRDAGGLNCLRHPSAALGRLLRTATDLRYVATSPELARDTELFGSRGCAFAQSAVDALAAVAQQGAQEYVAVVDLSAPLGNRLSAGANHMINALTSGAVLDYLTADPACPAVLTPPQPGERSPHAELQFSGDEPVYAPRFIGTYRRDEFARFASDELPRAKAQSAKLPGSELDSYLSMWFVQWLRSQNAPPTMLPIESMA